MNLRMIENDVTLLEVPIHGDHTDESRQQLAQELFDITQEISAAMGNTDRHVIIQIVDEDGSIVEEVA